MYSICFLLTVGRKFSFLQSSPIIGWEERSYLFSQSGDIFVGDIAAGENRGENVVRVVGGDKGVKEVLYLSEEQQELKG